MARLIYILLLTILLLGCQADAPRNAIRFGVPALPTSVHPLYATDAISVRVARLLFLPLVDFDERQQPSPFLADWSRLAPDRYRFRLKRDIPSFSDGSHLDADDIAATYRFVLDPGNGSPLRASLELIDAVEVIDDSTVDFVLSRADPLFPAALTVGIVPAEALRGKASRSAVPPGNGPFVVAGGDGNTVLALRRRRDGLPVEFVATRDPVVRLLKLLRGEIQILQNDLPPELFAYLEQRPEVRVVVHPGTNFTYLGFNLEDPVTGDVRVRRAIAHAIDREAIAKHVFRHRIRLAQTLFPPDHWLGTRLQPYPHDPARARQLLAEAGRGEARPVVLSYKTSADPFRLRLAAILQAQLAEVGIEVDLRSYDWGTFYGDVRNGNFQLYSLTWVGLKTPDSFRYLFHSGSVPPRGANRGRYRSARVDALVEAAEGLEDPAGQAAVYRELQQVLLAELPYVPLWYEDHIAVHRAEITGYRIALDGNYDGLESTRWVE